MDPGCGDADEAVLNMLRCYEVLTMDDLINSQPGFSWAQLFLAVDRLNRKHLISLRRIGMDYQICKMSQAVPLGRDQYHAGPAASHR